MAANVLIAGDWDLRWGLRGALLDAGFDVTLAASGEEAAVRFRDDHPDVVLLDMAVCLRDGLRSFQRMRREVPDAKVVLITDYDSTDGAHQAAELGAYHLVKKPLEVDDVVATVRNAALTTTLEKRVAYLAAEERRRGDVSGFVQAAPVMNRLREHLRGIVARPAPAVLVTGEPGAGKSAVTRLIHEESPRASGPFVEVNCAAIPDAAWERELFGRARCSFESTEHKIGLVEIADGGTLALTDVGELGPAAQVTLLSFLRRRAFRRPGASNHRRVDVQVVAATNHNLAALVASKRFRGDLLNALTAAVVHIPPLRQRRADILPLTKQFLAQTAAELGQGFSRVSPEALRILERYRWPGNVRELRTVIRRAAFLHDADVLGSEHLPPELVETARAAEQRRGLPPVEAKALHDAPADIDAGHLRWVLEICEGNATLAAQYLGTTRQNLVTKLRVAEARDENVERD